MFPCYMMIDNKYVQSIRISYIYSDRNQSIHNYFQGHDMEQRESFHYGDMKQKVFDNDLNMMMLSKANYVLTDNIHMAKMFHSFKELETTILNIIFRNIFNDGDCRIPFVIPYGISSEFSKNTIQNLSKQWKKNLRVIRNYRQLIKFCFKHITTNVRISDKDEYISDKDKYFPIIMYRILKRYFLILEKINPNIEIERQKNEINFAVIEYSLERITFATILTEASISYIADESNQHILIFKNSSSLITAKFLVPENLLEETFFFSSKFVMKEDIEEFGGRDGFLTII